MVGYSFTSGVDAGKITTCVGNEYKTQDMAGSGFIVKEDGTIVTNFHVISQTLGGIAKFDDGSSYEITRIKQWQQYYPADLAVLKITANKTFPTVNLGDSDTVRPMDKTLAVGNPRGQGINVTEGSISQLVRDEDNRIAKLQHTAAITGGNSGGALYRGQEVIGVNVTTWTGTQFHQAIPINLVKPLLESKQDKNLPLREVFGISTIAQKARQIDARNGTVPAARGNDPGTLTLPFDLHPLGTYLFVVKPGQGKNLPFFIWAGDPDQPYVLGCNNKIASNINGLFVEPPFIQNLRVGITLANATATPTDFGLESYLIVW